MDRRKRDFIIAAALVTVFFAMILKNIVGGPKAAPRSAAGPAATAAAEPESLAPVHLLRRNERILAGQEDVWAKDWGRDPFSTTTQVSVAAANLSLTGVVWDSKSPFAMINGTVLRVGDTIEGYRVVEIRQSSVVLWSDSGSFVELPLFEGASKAA